MICLRNIVIFLFMVCLAIQVFAKDNGVQRNFSLDLENVSLPKAIFILAKYMPKNVVISAHVTGSTTLHLKNVTPDEGFHLLLASHDLLEWRMGNSWYIAPRSELMKRRQDQLQWQNLSDEVAPILTETWQLHYAKAKDIAQLIQDNNTSLLSRRGHVRVDPRTNMICVQDVVSHVTTIKNVIKRLDIPVQQILIETRLASVDQDFERELGVQVGLNGGAGCEVIKNHFSLAVAKLADGAFLDVRLAAMENEGHGELISSPCLFTANQQAASIESGEEIPYQETSRNGATSVAFKKAVLSLKVIPQIMPHDFVLLQLQINQDRASNRQVLGVPAINTRQITTHVLVKNGQTVVLGGIFESNLENNQEYLPFFGKIPLVGAIFRRQNTLANKRELLIFVTPKIVSN